jgi:ferredoxin
VDRDACAGHGRCYEAAPSIFEPDEEGYPVVVGEATDAALLDDLRSARRNCPERAVLVSTTES